MSAPRILIVSASAGSGHVRAGDALLDAFTAAGAGAEHVDVLELTPRWVRAAYAGGFEFLASRAPRVWREIYERSDGPDGDAARWGAIATQLVFREFKRLLINGRFDTCVCTHFLPGQLAAGGAGLPPFSTVITDFAVHRYWVQPRVGTYFVSSSGMATELRQRLPRATVHVTGIPVNTTFACDRRPADAEWITVLVMGGGFGLGVESAAHAALAAGSERTRVIVVCGRNDDARRRLEQHPLAGSSRLEVHGFTRNIPELMAGADLVVTKPGGLTTSEALAAGRPLLLTRGMPGHEDANVRYLVGVGAALATPTDQSITDAVHRFSTNEAFRTALQTSAIGAGRIDAAPLIAVTVLAAAQCRAAA